MINFNKQLFSQIKYHALNDNPNECCGLIIETGNKNIAVPTRNCAENKEHNFSINPYDYMMATDIGKPVGFYHSHCSNNEQFSDLDIHTSVNHKLPMLLYNIISDNFKIYNESEDKLSKYIGIKFQYNVSDCASLIQNFYKNEFNIHLPHVHRDSSWAEKTPQLISENISNFGFKQTKDLKYGDIIVTKFLNEHPRHLMIYVGNNQILHNRRDSYSMIEEYSYNYKKITMFVIRHNKLWN